MPLYTDQLGREVFIKPHPQRIISLVPSQTELLHDLGLTEEVIGITKFCVHPQSWFRSKTRVGGTKQIHLHEIKALNPDLIIANKEENVKDQIEELAKDFPVWISDVHDLDTALNMMTMVESICGKKREAEVLTKSIIKEFETLQFSENSRPRTAYLIWREPYMTIGGDTFIHQMLQYAGFDNLFKDQTRYPVIDIPQLQELDCRLLLLSSEPYPFGQKHIDELKDLLPHTKIMLVDGELFSWYGSHLLEAPAYFKKLHQQVMSFENSGYLR